MVGKIVSERDIIRFEEYLFEEEMSKNTIEKYLRDVRKFQAFAQEKEITKKLTREYKEYLLEHFKIHSVNSFIVSLNRFLKFIECFQERLKTEKVQESVYAPDERSLSKREYERLVETAFRNGKERLAFIMQTICSTGIRISELQFITVEAIKKGYASVRNKGKCRDILIPGEMRELLRSYAKENGIASGAVFVTRSGKPVDRSNICRDMKKLCREASVEPTKCFPHNLRHLFARMFYQIEKNLVKLADVLGHSSIDTTRLYLKSTSKEHSKLLEKMKLVMWEKTLRYQGRQFHSGERKKDEKTDKGNCVFMNM